MLFMSVSTVPCDHAPDHGWAWLDDSRGGAMWRRPCKHAIFIALISLSAVLALGCGGSTQKRQAQRLENVSVLSNTAPLSDRLVKQSEVRSASDTAAVRTFSQLWSLLQYQAWDQAEQLFQPGLREAIGASLLSQALAQNVVMWQATKPKIVTATSHGSTALITFLARNEAGTVVPASISFQQASGSWLVSYFSLLDGAIQRTVQRRTQAQIEPLATKPSPEAVRQGFAAMPLQSNYLERQARAAAKRGHGGAGTALP
jgi:hypothetical protein